MNKLFNDYDISLFLNNHNQNEVGPCLKQIYKEIGKIESKEDFYKIFEYVKTNFILDKNEEKFKRTSEQIAQSKTVTGCSDIETLITPILRMNKIPTIYVQTANIDWVKDLLNDREDKKNVRGHVFLETYLDNKWILCDFVKGIIYEDYDYRNPSIPNNYFTFYKSYNGHSVGVCSTLENNVIMSSLFSYFDLDNYKDPKYKETKMEDIKIKEEGKIK